MKDLLKNLLCVKDECPSLTGSSWLVPLLLHREPQVSKVSNTFSFSIKIFSLLKIRAMSFSITSLIVTVTYGRTKLLAYQNGIWSIALSVLLNRFESSIVRVEACSLLVNLLKPMINEDVRNVFFILKNLLKIDFKEQNMTITSLQLILQENNFFSEIAILLTSFYPFDTYSLDAIMSTQTQNISSNLFLLT